MADELLETIIKPVAEKCALQRRLYGDAVAIHLDWLEPILSAARRSIELAAELAVRDKRIAELEEALRECLCIVQTTTPTPGHWVRSEVTYKSEFVPDPQWQAMLDRAAAALEKK